VTIGWPVTAGGVAVGDAASMDAVAVGDVTAGDTEALDVPHLGAGEDGPAISSFVGEDARRDGRALGCSRGVAASGLSGVGGDVWRRTARPS